METIYLPLINPGDYDAFRDLMKGYLPNTYDEWGDLHVKRATDILGRGDRYVEVKVYPDEFTDYCRANGHVPNPIILDRYAVEKRARDKK